VTVVFDTNVLVAALVARGVCHEAFRRAVRRRLLASSQPLLDELEATIRRQFSPGPSTATFLNALRLRVRLVEPATLPHPVCRDPDDDIVLATAVSAGADLVVTGDQDLLVLESHEGIRIISPRRFLEWLDGHLPEADAGY